MAQFNVNLAFNADTGKAKTQIMELQSLLNKIAYAGASSSTGGIQKDLNAASEAAKELQFHLNNAFNTSTGNFDLSMLDRSLKTSGSNITDLSTKLLSAGATGQQAFVKLAQSISLADQPMLRISKRMQDFAVTMKNTVKWQLSSSMLHGFMGAVQSAYGYAKDLNKSLNDIRIVTGYNTDKMAEFAEQANKAAKSLSTTTTDYTNASLIYFQQGLTDKEVAERTDITVKMANAVGQSAEVVSEQLTAVWNNFDDGSQSLEYYVDVMTALGAATASSSDEISEGLSKFAAVAGSVGLSYEYATAALATLTSNTRESADVVGNALKTLFARIQGLKLGETLDDGTDLNKYSAALDQVGISIYDANGGLKDMDNILDEMAAKWNTLSDTQQVALAQTVAGVRQYNQLIALMENWNNGDSDSMIANLSTISESEGALQKQADIYAQSWEAAEKRVKAAAEGIFQSLLDDKFFISLNNGFANLLGGLDAFIDGAGGIKIILTGIGGIVTSVFSHKIPEALDTFKYNLEIMTKGTQAAYNRIQKDMNEANQIAFTGYNKKGQQVNTNIVDENSSIGIAIKQANELTAARNKLTLVSDKMSNAEKQAAEAQLNYIQEQQKEIVALKEKNEELQKSISLQQQSIRQSQISDNTRIKTLKSSEDVSNMFLTYNDTLSELEDQRNRTIEIINERSARGQNVQRQEDNLTRINAEIEQYEALSYAALGFADNYKATMQVINNTNNTIGHELFDIFSGENFDTALQHPIHFADEFNIAFDQIEETLTSTNLDFSDKLNLKTVKDQIKALQSTIPEAIQSATGLDVAFNRVFTAMDENQLQQAFLGLRLSIENCTLEGEDFQRVLEGLYGKSITQIANDMQRLEENTAKAEQKASVLKTLLDEFNPSHTVRISEAMGSLAGLMSNVVTIGNTLVSMFQALNNPDLSGWEKFSAVLTGLSVLIPTILSSLQAAVTINDFLSKSYSKSAIAIGIDTAAKTISTKVTTALGIANTGLVASMGPLLVIIGAVAVALTVLAGIVKLITIAFEAWKASTPEGKLEAAKETTEAMATAAQDATTAYQNLLNTISGYDSAVVALESLEIGTQEFTNALITANEKAWELIDTYGLIQGQDWDYGKNGEIIINDSAKSRITKEANERREDAVVATSAATVAQEEAAYNVAKSNAGYFGSTLTEQVRQQLYGALGFTDGSSGHIQNQWLNAKTDEDYNQIINKIGSKHYGDKWDISNANMVDFIRSAIANMDKIGTMYNAYSDLIRTEANERQKMISTSLSDEEAYQKTAWKDVITDTLEAQYEIEKAQQDKVMTNKTDEQIANDFAKYLTDQNYIQGEDGKVYKKNADGTQGDEVTELSNLSANAQRNILAAVEAMKVLETQGIEMAEGFNQVASTMTEEETAMANALINGNLGALTEEQIEKLKAVGNIKPEDLFDPETLAAIRDNPVLNAALEDWLKELEKQVAEWKPPEFNLESWKSDYAAKMDIINDLETGDTIPAEDYDILGEEYQQYFSLQADGTAILIAKAEELKVAAENIEVSKLKEDIHSKQNTINSMNKANIVTESGGELDFNAAHSAALEGTLSETWNEAYISSINEALKENYTTVAEASIAYETYVQSLNNSQSILASTASTIDNLNQMYSEGLITLEQYNEAFKGTVIKEAQAEDLNVEELQEYAKYLQETSDLTEELALQIALSEKKQGKAVDDLVDNYKDYASVLKKAKLDAQIKDTEKYSKAITSLRKDLKLLTGVSEDVFTDEFINSDKVQKSLQDVANGVDGAIEKLKTLAVLEDIQVNASVKINDEQLLYLENELAAISAEDIEIGTMVNNSAALMGLYDLLYEAGLTADQIQSYFNDLGWNPELDYVKMTAAEAASNTSYTNKMVWVPDGMGWKQVQLTDVGNMGISGETEIWVPRIGSKGGGGGFKKIDPPGSSFTKTPSGGGGGSKPTKKSDSDKTRYHTLQNQLEDLKSEYEDISDAADRAFGKDKLKLMDDQIDKTDELIEKQEEYLAAIQDNLPKDKAIMEAYYNDLIGGPAIEFDERGNISNYDAIQDAMYEAYNTNAEAMSSEDWEAFEKKYEKLEKYIEQYEETYDLLRDEEQAYQDLLNQRMDEQLAKIQYQVELKMQVADDGLEVLEYQLGRLEDDAFAAAEAIALFGDKAELLYDKMEANRKGLDDILGQQLSSAEINLFMAGDLAVLEGKMFTEAQIEQIRAYRSDLLSLNEEMLQVREDVQSKVMETFDAWNEKLQEGIDKFDHYSSVLTSYKNIVDLVGKSYLGVDNQLLKSMNDAMIENSLNKVSATRLTYEALLQDQATAQQQYNEAIARGNENDIKFWSDTLEEIGKNVEEAQENMLSTWEETLKIAAEEFQRQVDIALEEFNKALTGFASLEQFREKFDFAKEVEDQYVPAYEKIYELSKLNRDINKTLGDDKVVKGKEKLIALQEKINQYQKDGVEMSEYEIENLQKEYDLRMAEIALEEARNAKDTVRLSKDNEGNWSYIYTTDTTAVDEAQQKYEDALFAMQQLNDEYINEMSNLILDATERMQEEIANLRLEDFASQAEYDAAVQEIADKYLNRIQYGQDQMQLAIDNSAILYEQDWKNYSDATGYKIATDQEYVDSFNETILGTLLESESQVVNVYEMINDSIGNLLDDTSSAYEQWVQTVDSANQAAGTSTQNFADDVNNAVNGPNGIVDSSNEALDSIEEMAQDMINNFDEVSIAVSNWQEDYSDAIDDIIEKNLEAIEVCNALLEVLSDVQDVDLSNLTTPKYDPYGKTYDNTTNSKDDQTEIIAIESRTPSGGSSVSSSGGGGGNRGPLSRIHFSDALITMDTGGYTGEWGSSGRLAMLHEKELVLNPDDTSNMLKTISLTKQILDTIDLNARYASTGLGQVVASSIKDSVTSTLEQSVMIQAEFPSITDHNEVELALKNLINTASQYANRK